MRKRYKYISNNFTSTEVKNLWIIWRMKWNLISYDAETSQLSVAFCTINALTFIFIYFGGMPRAIPHQRSSLRSDLDSGESMDSLLKVIQDN